MKVKHWRPLALVAICAFGALFVPAAANPVPVDFERVPDAGIQPQVAVDEHGTVHLLYFKGDPSSGDLLYTTSKDGLTFSRSIRVNSVSGSAVALGNIRGARIALGRDGKTYVVWNGSAKMGNPSAGRSPMLFTRLNESRTAFEPQRDLIHTAWGIDGGGGIAADQQGHVYVFWHAPIPGQHGEDSRRVWMTRSEDDGKSFTPERLAWDQPTGVCGCCSLNAHVDPDGKVYILFRSAEAAVHRDMYLLESGDHGASFHGSAISKWKVGYCVMSSESFVSARSGTFAAWETGKQVHLGLIKPGTATASDLPVSGASNQKYPSLAMNRAGLVLASWTEGMAWKHGGSAHWQLFDSVGRPMADSGFADGVPPWSLVAAYPRTDGSFVVLY